METQVQPSAMEDSKVRDPISFIENISTHITAKISPINSEKCAPGITTPAQQKRSERLLMKGSSDKKVMNMAQEVLGRKLGYMGDDQSVNEDNLGQYQEMFKKPLSKETMMKAEKILDDYTPKRVMKSKKLVAAKINGSGSSN